MHISQLIRAATLAGFGLTFAGAVLAEDLALVIGNGDYQHQRNIRRVSSSVVDLISAYRTHGYDVIEGFDVTNAEFREVLAEFEEKSAGADRVVVHYTGYTLHAGDTTWLAPVDLVRGTIVDTAYGAVALDAVLEILAQKPGHAALFIGTFDNANRTAGALRPGLGAIDVPQGVFALTGNPTDVVNAVEDSILVEDVPVATALGKISDKLTVDGFISPDSGFGRISVVETIEDGADDIDRERQLWATAQENSTVENLEAYLKEYPNGAFAIIARNRLERLRGPQEDPAKAIEKALNLTRTERRGIQEDLVVLGYDTRGVDGIFGPGTRKAISKWQEDQDFQPSGYVSRVQIRLMESLAAKRAQEIAREAERKRKEEERADLAFWRSTGATGTPEGLREYLDAYPDGIYSREAADALADIEAEERAAAEAADTEAWDRALATDSIEGYRNYIDRYPNGAFVDTANARIRRLRGEPDEDEVAEFERVENRLGMSTQVKALIESRLKNLSYNPGRVDGHFDQDTRSAIRKFQRSQGLEVTGYMNGTTVRQLIVASR